jgi:hypothetical protein
VSAFSQAGDVIVVVGGKLRCVHVGRLRGIVSVPFCLFLVCASTGGLAFISLGHSSAKPPFSRFDSSLVAPWMSAASASWLSQV